MRRHYLEAAALTITLASAVAVAAWAQETPPPSPRRQRTMSVTVSPGDMLAEMRHGRMGITLDIRPATDRDTVGARVAGVTPGGPADRAGVHSGDLITRLNGTRLAAAENARAGDEADADEQSRPAMRLLRMASRLDAGDTVRLDVLRDSRPMTFTFVTEASDAVRIVEGMRIPGPGAIEMNPLMPGGAGETRMNVFTLAGAIPSDLELVKLNAGLGEYFGTSEGLLVVDVGADSAIGLRAGDVILSIGGRRPASPPQAMRILGTYEPNEAVQFEVMRLKRRVAVTGHMPARRQGPWRVRPNNFEFRVEPGPGEIFDRVMPRILERLPMPHLEIDGVPKLMIKAEGRI
jgi:membrane-associated protease RseP (regulator of RpoE activity)